MVYVTNKYAPAHHQMTLEELFAYRFSAPPQRPTRSETSTVTRKLDQASNRLRDSIDVTYLIRKLNAFNAQTQELREKERDSLYTTFYVPKKSGGLRQIDAPCAELMDALRILRRIFEEDFHALYHTSAYAYIPNRCTVDVLKVHQRNQSKWFVSLDLHNFFGSTTLDFIMQQFGMVFPFSEIVRYPAGRSELRTALSLATKNGVLPQGTPISPLITNVMMIPIDYELTKRLRDFEKNRYVVTRYADDFDISSKYDFDYRKVEGLVKEVLASFNAPFTINEKKTHYCSSAGKNYMLGLLLNKDNEITVGHKAKRQFQKMLHAYVMDRRNGKPWDLHDVQVLKGHYEYFNSVEKGAINGIISHMNEKLDANILAYIQEDLKL